MSFSNRKVVIGLILLAGAAGCSHEKNNPLHLAQLNNSGNQPGAVIDDGKTYKTLTLGTQTWMVENLNKGSFITGFPLPGNGVEKFCYTHAEVNCSTYGGLYTWDELMNYETLELNQGICPDGWHLPTDSEWKTLEQYLGMSAGDLDKNDSWRGTDEGTQLKSGGTSKFEALMGGKQSPGVGFKDVNSGSYFWTSSQVDGALAIARQLSASLGTIKRHVTMDKADALSIRCIKD